MTQPEIRADGRHNSDSQQSGIIRAEQTANGTSNGSASSLHSDEINVSDPRTRVLLEQLLTTLSSENTTAPDKGTRGPSLGSYLGMFRRRWKPMLLIFVLALAAVSWKLKPGETFYVASTTMLLPGSSGASSSDAALAALGVGKDAPGGMIDTQIAIIQSPTFLQNVRRISKERLSRLGKPTTNVESVAVAAAAPVSPELINITVTAADPDTARVFANASVDAYADRTRERGDELHAANMRQVGQQVKEVDKRLRDAKNALQRYKNETGVFSVETELARSSQQIQELEAKARAARIDVEAGLLGSSVLTDSITNNLQQKAADAKLKHQTILRDFFPDSPEARAAESEWRAAQAQVDQRARTLMNRARQQASDAQRELSEARQSAARLPSVEFRLSQLNQQVAQLEALYKALTDRYNGLSLTRNSKTATATNISPAVAASAASRTWSRALLTGFMVALMLALACAVLMEQLDTSLHSTEDLEPLLPAAVLGSMPLLKGRTERRLAHITGAQPMAPLVLESCRIIRSNLAFATMDSPVRSVLLTSADPGEGKSLSALNLATVMAFDGRSVVLLDCDLRRPSQHTLNGLGLEPGMTNVLSGEATLEEVLQSTSVANLKVITAGTLPLNPPELLGSTGTRELLNTLKEMFDIVIIDSPPVLALTDAQVLCSVADGVVMVVAADSTPKAHVQRAQAMLRHAGGRLLGAVFNKVKENHTLDTYGGYYSYGAGIAGQEKQLSESMGGLKKRA
jgi:capsular exopolysaccharide synthesis family protein